MRDLEKDVVDTDWLRERITSSEEYARAFYSTLCNNAFKHKEGGPLDIWTCSWRYAGEMLSNIRAQGDYSYYYCSGNEGVIDPEVRFDIAQIGWNILDNYYSKLYPKEEPKTEEPQPPASSQGDPL
jgi:hypothetical protein